MQSFERPRARAEAEHLEERLHLRIAEPSEDADRLSRLLPRPEDAEIALDLAFVLLLGPAPGVVRRPHPPRKGAPNDECRRPLRVGRREEDAHRRSLGEAVERSSSRADGVHDGTDVVHARLERGRAADAVGHAGAALVEADQPRERRQPLEERREARYRPVKLEMRDVAGDEDEIERAVARDLIGDVDVAAPRVLDVRNFHGRQCPPQSWFLQRRGAARSARASLPSLETVRERSRSSCGRFLTEHDFALSIRGREVRPCRGTPRPGGFIDTSWSRKPLSRPIFAE